MAITITANRAPKQKTNKVHTVIITIFFGALVISLRQGIVAIYGSAAYSGLPGVSAMDLVLIPVIILGSITGGLVTGVVTALIAALSGMVTGLVAGFGISFGVPIYYFALSLLSRLIPAIVSWFVFDKLRNSKKVLAIALAGFTGSASYTIVTTVGTIVLSAGFFLSPYLYVFIIGFLQALYCAVYIPLIYYSFRNLYRFLFPENKRDIELDEAFLISIADLPKEEQEIRIVSEKYARLQQYRSIQTEHRISGLLFMVPALGLVSIVLTLSLVSSILLKLGVIALPQSASAPKVSEIIVLLLLTIIFWLFCISLLLRKGEIITSAIFALRLDGVIPIAMK